MSHRGINIISGLVLIIWPLLFFSSFLCLMHQVRVRTGLHLAWLHQYGHTHLFILSV